MNKILNFFKNLFRRKEYTADEEKEILRKIFKKIKEFDWDE